MITPIASPGLKAGTCSLLTFDDASAWVPSWLKVTAHSPYVLEAKELLGFQRNGCLCARGELRTEGFGRAGSKTTTGSLASKTILLWGWYLGPGDGRINVYGALHSSDMSLWLRNEGSWQCLGNRTAFILPQRVGAEPGTQGTGGTELGESLCHLFLLLPSYLPLVWK